MTIETPAGHSRFRWRRGDISRLEAFSDGVFAFALTLLVVSLEVPRSVEDLIRLMTGFPAFAACFAILVWIWYEHYAFFGKYALRDGWTIVLNSVLLFLVLFYVYPLKFVFALIGTMIFGASGIATPTVTSPDQVVVLMVAYGAGFVAIFLLLALLHGHALRLAPALGLSPVERFDTRSAVVGHLASASIGLLSIVCALSLPSRLAGLAGFCFGLLGPVHTARGILTNRRRTALFSPDAATPARRE